METEPLIITSKRFSRFNLAEHIIVALEETVQNQVGGLNNPDDVLYRQLAIDYANLMVRADQTVC